MPTDIWDDICAVNSLKNAFDKVRRNGGAAGGDHVSIDQYGFRLESRLKAVSRHLLDGTFQHGPCARFDIPKRNGGMRRLMVPPVEDRVIHTSIAMQLSPVLEPYFEDASFAYRPGRSVQQAVAAIERWRNQGYCQVIEADIRNYFNSVRHHTLNKMLFQHIQHVPGHAPLCDFIAEALEHQGNELGDPGRGLVQGSPMSPLLANLYLDILDEELHGSGVRIVRFADDFIILCKKQRHVEDAFEEMEEVLASIGLELHAEKTRVVDFNKGFEFLGYLFVRSLSMPKETNEWSSQALASPRPASTQVSPRSHTNPVPRKLPDNVAAMSTPSSWNDEDEIFEHDSPKSGSLLEAAPTPVIRKDYARGDRIMYVLEHGRIVSAEKGTILISSHDMQPLLAVNATKVDRLEIGRNVRVTDQIIDRCINSEIELIFLDGHGEARAWLRDNNDFRALLQFEQAKACADPEITTALTRKIVVARIRNQRTQLFRLNRRQEIDDVNQALDRMGRKLRKLEYIHTVDGMRGIEGASGADYWQALGRLCEFHGLAFKRSRPARDPLNAAINFLTAILERDVRAAISSTGLHTGFGFLHKPRDYAQAAVYDLMEPFRAPLTEGLAVFLFNSKRLRRDMFTERDGVLIRLSAKGRRAIITGYEQAIAKRVNITGEKRKLAWRPMMRHQALTLAKAYSSSDPELFKPYLMEA